MNTRNRKYKQPIELEVTRNRMSGTWCLGFILLASIAFWTLFTLTVIYLF